MNRPSVTAEMLVLAAVAGWARLIWLPVERHRFDGHELDYLRAFQGEVLAPSTRHLPMLAGAYRALGKLTDDPMVLLLVNVAAGIATVLAAAWLAERRFGRDAARATGLLLALAPTLVFWSASAYHVAIPVALAVGGMALGGWPGALLYALGCANRLELAALAPAVAVLGGWRVSVGAVGAAAGLTLLASAPPLTPLATTLPVNLLLPDYLGALGTPLGLLIVVLALKRSTVAFVAAAAWVHLVGACFDDYGTRHGMLGAVALAVAVGASGRRWVVAVALAWSVWQTWLVTLWFYEPGPRFEAMLPEVGAPPPCTEIFDDPLVPASHWRMREAWPEGTVCWGEERIHRAWTSRGLMDRALRMRRIYDPEPIGVLNLESGPRVFHELTR